MKKPGLFGPGLLSSTSHFQRNIDIDPIHPRSNKPLSLIMVLMLLMFLIVILYIRVFSSLFDFYYKGTKKFSIEVIL